MAVFDRGPDFEPAMDPIVRNDARRLRLKLLEYYRHANSEPSDHVLIDIPKGGYVPVFLPRGCRDNNEMIRHDLPRRLGVLPFEVLSVLPEYAIYGRALCMSLTANLTDLDGFEAIAHAYIGEQSIREAASALHLSHVIHGSVLKTSDGCRIIINLIQVPAGTQIWAREYNFDIESSFIHSEIAADVRRELAGRLGPRLSEPNCLALAA